MDIRIIPLLNQIRTLSFRVAGTVKYWRSKRFQDSSLAFWRKSPTSLPMQWCQEIAVGHFALAVKVKFLDKVVVGDTICCWKVVTAVIIRSQRLSLEKVKINKCWHYNLYCCWTKNNTRTYCREKRGGIDTWLYR